MRNYSKVIRQDKLYKLKILNCETLLPFNEKGVIVDYEIFKLDFFPYKIKITKSNNFNMEGDIVEYRHDQIKILT